MPKNYDSWSKEELIRELKKAEGRKKYGIVWEDKPEQVALLCKEKLPILVEDKDKEIITDKEKTNNIIIEGDNYHVLSVLNYTHKGKIDVIYIDPPYNTGNGDTFRYNDKLVDKEDTYRHSKWLSFMAKRLHLIKGLLTNQGVILISIDDNEYAQLKLLCDEIFDEENFLGTFVWEGGLKNDSRFISKSHDYILCYVKSIRFLSEYKITWRMKKQGIDLIYNAVEKFKKEYEADYLQISEVLRKWYSELSKTDLAWSHRHYNKVDEKGVYFPGDISWPGGGGPKYIILHPLTNKPVKIPARGWVFSKKESFDKAVKENRIDFGYDETNIPKLKRYLSETEGQVLPSVFYKDRRAAKKQLRALLGKDLFENPKDVDIIKNLVATTSSQNALVLDFFAGSGTTGNAVLELNKEDGGNRKFILCTNNENNICTEVCYPRVKKVIQNLEKESKDKLVKNMPGNLKYFKTDFVDAEPTDDNKKNMVDKSTEMLCLKEDCFEEIKGGQEYKIFTNGQGKFLGIIYDDAGIAPFKKEIKNLKQKIAAYVFSLDESAREEDFEDVMNLVDLKPIPAVILNVYKRIFK